MSLLGRVGSWILVLIAFAVTVVIAGVLLLSTDWAHRYILGVITQRIQQTTGGRVEIGRLSFHHAHLGADFYGIRVRGTEAERQMPLFSADRVAIDLGLHLLHRKKLDLEDIILDHPEMHVSIDPHGNSNLPHAGTSASGTPPGIFDLAIGHFVLNNGEIFYKDRHAPVTADLRNLNARVSYSVLTKTYDGTLSYRDARVDYGTFAPMTHNLSASFSAAPSGIVFKSVTVQTSLSSIQAQGALTNYAAPSISGSYQASLSTKDLRNLFKSSSIPEGEVDTQGTVAYTSKPDEPVINAFSIFGKLSGRSLKVLFPQIRANLQNVTAEYRLDQGNLEARKIEAASLGGHVTGQLFISHLAGEGAARFNGSVQGASLSAMQQALSMARNLGLRMEGKLGGKAQVTWRGSLNDLKVVSDAKMAGSIASVPAKGHASRSFPIDAAAQLSYDGRNQSALIRDGLIHTPHGYLTVNGGLGKNMQLQVEGRSDDLREIDVIASTLLGSSAAPGKSNSSSSQPLGLAGAATFSGTVSGPLSNPHFAALVTATDLQVRGTSVQAFRANVQLSRTNVAAQQGEISIGPRSNANFDISVALRDWHFTPDNPLRIRLTSAGLSIADIQHVVGFSYPVTGLLSANVTIRGTQENPDASGNITVSQATLWQQPVRLLTIALRSAEDDLNATVDLRTPAGSASATLLYYPNNREYELQATSKGIRLDQVQYLQSHFQKLAGVINASVKGRGKLNAPQLEATIDGQPQIGDQKIDNFKAQASIANQQSVFTLDCSLARATFQAHGAVNLTGDYEATANVDTQPIQLDSFLSTFLPQTNDGLHGQTEVHATLRGPLKDPTRVEAHLEIPSLSVGYSSVQLAAVGPIHADYRQGILAVQQATFKGTGTEIRVAATVPFQSTSTLRATADGTVDLGLLQLWNPQWQSSGQIKLNVNAQGTRSHPEVNGTIAVSNAGLSIDNIPSVEKLTGELDINAERVQIKSLTGQLGGGRAEIHGFAAYRPGMRYNLGMTARGVRLLYPEGIRTQGSVDLNFIGDAGNSMLSGQVLVSRLSLSRGFDLLKLSNAFGGSSVSSPGMADNIKLNVAVSSSSSLEVSNNQLSLEGTADLRVQGTAADPVIIGRTNVTGGELFFNGKRFEIQNASIVFANPVRTELVMNLAATTTVNQFNLTVNLVGPLDRLRTTYTSDPPLSQVDIIDLLITGHTATSQPSTSSVSPESVVASQLSGEVSNRLGKLTGISSLTIDPQIGGNQGNAGSQLAIQQKVTKNLFFTFATDVTTTQGEVIQVEYQFTPKYSVSAIRDQSGGYEVEIKSHKTF